ncbi:unnamed protein product [Chondrus crispus]|uniref:Major facilitator superfamily (MFS) profile domain-containing protein n=1 Tax=Chondrus crispus TaxID=2769 RepID=S0F3V1_CHOCR|nr:unnamed protein product [Chondrus crispus]CDF77473.1 unnamed protein product [Chondrus crispus]|eukprot:XP_005712347.1 unnamed protein product [Chondrus crispus]
MNTHRLPSSPHSSKIAFLSTPVPFLPLQRSRFPHLSSKRILVPIRRPPRRCSAVNKPNWTARIHDTPPDFDSQLSSAESGVAGWLINISVAILPMAKYYGWSQTTVGVIQSAFFWGYVLTQIPGGYLADKYGGKQVLAAGVVVWSAMTILTPLAASTNLGVLLLARALLGVGEGVAMPAMNNMISKWVPETERSRSLSLTYSGMYLGSVVGLLLCPAFIVSFGWQSVFYFFGALGFFWWAAWQFWTKSTPELSTTMSEKERAYINSKMRAGAANKSSLPTSVPWKLLFSKKATWGIIIAHFCATWGYFVLLIWLPTYFNQQLGFDLAASSFLSVMPWLAMFVSANAGGFIADAMRARNISITTVRKTMQSIGFLGPAAFLALVSTTTDPAMAVTYMTTALALGSFSQSGVYANHQDIGPAFSGILLGISNTGAAIPGIVGVALTGYILDTTGSWSLVFGIAIFFYLFGTVAYNALGTGERVF